MGKCRKRDSRRPDALAIQQLGPPPLAQDPDMLFAALPDPSRLPQQEMALPACVDRRRMRARIGRGGGCRLWPFWGLQRAGRACQMSSGSALLLSGIEDC